MAFELSVSRTGVQNYSMAGTLWEMQDKAKEISEIS